MKSGFGRESRFSRYFEGYEKQTYIDGNGREKVKMVYTLDYYRPRMTEKAFTGRKILNVILFLLAAGAQLFAGLRQDIPMNLSKIMGFAECLGILAMILVAIYLCSHLSAPYNMEIRSFRNAHDKFTVMSLIGTCILGAVFLAALVMMIIFKSFTFMSFVWAFMYLLAAVCILAIWMLEKRTEYDKVAHNSAF